MTFILVSVDCSVKQSQSELYFPAAFIASLKTAVSLCLFFSRGEQGGISLIKVHLKRTIKTDSEQTDVNVPKIQDCVFEVTVSGMIARDGQRHPKVKTGKCGEGMGRDMKRRLESNPSGNSP